MKPVLMICFGTRAEALKLAPVINQLKGQYSVQMELLICSTGHHQDLLVPSLKQFDISPDIDLKAIKYPTNLSDLTAEIIRGVSYTIKQVNPSALAVLGDTTSCFGAALAAFYNRVPVLHLEAGLRSYDRFEPFPEEINRRFITQIASYHFATHEVAKANLLREGVLEKNIFVAGNTLWDTFTETWKRSQSVQLPFDIDDTKQIILVTLHRRENIPHGIHSSCKALGQIVQHNNNTVVYFILHPNPKIKNIVTDLLGYTERVNLLPALPHDMFLALMERADVVLTDSGGVSEEAGFLGIPTLILRRATERQHLIQIGIAQLIGTSTDSILEYTLETLSNLDSTTRHQRAVKPAKSPSKLLAEHIANEIMPNTLVKIAEQ